MHHDPNVTGQDRPTGCKNSDCSERKPSHNGSLWVVAWTRLFNEFFRFFMPEGPQKSQKQPKNRVFGLVEPVFSIFRPIFGVIFIFCAVARIFLLLFLCHCCRRYFTVIFQYFLTLNVSVHPRRTLCDVGCNALLGLLFL